MILTVPGTANAACKFLLPLGGNGNEPDPHIVTKRVERPKGLIGSAVGRPNWNTDFVVDQPYRTFKLFFTADSMDGKPGAYSIQAYLKFASGGSMKVVDERMKPPTGTGAQLGPFVAPAGQGVSQVNFKIGTNNDPKASGFI